MNDDAALKATALQQAIDYHRAFESGTSVAAVQRGKEPVGPRPGAVVDTARLFLAFLQGSSS